MSPHSLRYPVSVLTLATLFAALAPVTVAQQPQESASQERRLASMVGRVISASTGRPLDGAVVSFVGSGTGAITDSTGNFNIPQTWAGIDTVEVRFIGFTPSRTELNLEPNVTTRVVFLLSETVLRVAELTVEIKASRRATRLRGFEERREKGFGVFFTPRDIRTRNPRLSSDLLRGLPGVTVGRIEYGRAPVYMTRGSSRGDCMPAVYLDGVYQSGLWVDDIPRDDLGAVEVYRSVSETPAEYLRTAGRTCGAVVIWTPDGPGFFENYEPPERRR